MASNSFFFDRIIVFAYHSIRYISKNSYLMKKITLAAFLCSLFLFNSCDQYQAADLAGLWISSDDSQHAICIRNDSLFYENYPPTPFHIKGNKLLRKDQLFTFVFELEEEQLRIELPTQNDVKTYHKSTSTTATAHRLAQLNMHFQLPKGYGEFSIPKKTTVHQLDIAYKDQQTLHIALDGKIMEMDQLHEAFQELIENESAKPHVALAIDEQLPFQVYLQLYNRLTNKQTESIQLHHAGRVQSFDWDNVAHHQTHDVMTSVKGIDWSEQAFQYIDIQVIDHQTLSIDGSKIDHTEWYKHLFFKYKHGKHRAASCFRITPNTRMTYGTYLALNATLNRVVDQSREDYAQDSFLKSYQKMKQLAKEVKDTEMKQLIQEIKTQFPKRILVQTSLFPEID